MEFLGDLSFIIGTIGIVIYMCLIIIRFTTQAGKIQTAIKKYEERTVKLQEKLKELKERRSTMDPEVDKLVEQMIEGRSRRDKLQMQYEDMVAKSQERDINIKFNAH